jgi:CPA2 family monovalent cation:H+ antiporter-2
MNLLFTILVKIQMYANISILQPPCTFPDLISDLGLILVTAAIAVLIFRILKQPLVLGYLVAGFLAGSEFDFFPTVKDMNSVKVWAEIGVIFLLFSLGLEFSFKKLMKVGGTASITALTQIISMVALGYFVGQLMDWGKMNSLFLGVILSISSTTIILKTFDELGVKTQKFAGNVIGALIVQDILAILMMVLLSTVAVSQQFSGTELLQSVLKLVFFLTIWFVAGIFFIPTLLKKAKHLLTDEMLLIVSLALCLLMVLFAANVGFSPALGAFIMGSIIAETTQAEHIEHLVKPVKDLFGAVFFVSVGMLIDPEMLMKYGFPVGILTLVVILRTIAFLNNWRFTFGSTVETIHSNRNEFIANWRVFVHHCHIRNDVKCNERFLVSNCGCSFSYHHLYNAIHGEIFNAFIYLIWRKNYQDVGLKK